MSDKAILQTEEKGDSIIVHVWSLNPKQVEKKEFVITHPGVVRFIPGLAGGGS